MLKYARFLAAWGIPVAVIVILLVGAQSLRIPVPPATYNECLQATQKSRAKQADCKSYETVWNRTLVDPVAYYTLWLTIFTGALAAVGVAQWSLISGQLKLSRDEFSATHRPRIAMREITFSALHDLGSINFFVSNVGEGEAVVMESHFSIVTKSPKEPTGPLGNKIGEIDGLRLGAGRHHPCYLNFGGPALELLEMMRREPLKKAMAGNPYLIFRGFIVYADPVTNIRRRMAFCRGYDVAAECFLRMDESEYEYAD